MVILHSVHLISCNKIDFTRFGAQCPASVDLETLFGNIYEVVELSQQFLNTLEANTAGRPYEEQMIGNSPSF